LLVRQRRAYSSSCPKGPSGDEEPRLHQGPPFRTGRFGRFITRSRWSFVAIPGLVARRDVTGIPVSVLPSGGRSRGPPAVDPLDANLEARLSADQR